MMSEKQKPKHFLDKELFVYHGTWFETKQEMLWSGNMMLLRQAVSRNWL